MYRSTKILAIKNGNSQWGIGMNIVEMSFYGGILILIITIVRALLKDRLPGKTFPILWMIAMVRLLCSFSIPFSMSVYTLIDRLCPMLDEKANVLRGQWGAEVSMQKIQDSPPIQSGAEGVNARSLLLIVWLFGVLMVLGYFVFTYIRCYREFRMALPVENAYIGNWKRMHPLRRKLSVRQSDRISSPLTYGIFKPVILMPKSTKWEAEKELQYILEHEYVHIQRWDAVFKLLMITVLCLHWFNPLVWLMYLLLNRDLELSCDEAVIRRFGRSMKQEYAVVLIDMAERQNKVLPAYCSFGKHPIEERIHLIMKRREVTRVSCGLAVILIVSIVLAFTTSADEMEEHDEKMAVVEGKTAGENLTEPLSVTEQQASDNEWSDDETEAAIREEMKREAIARGEHILEPDDEIKEIWEKINAWFETVKDENGKVYFDEDTFDEYPEIEQAYEKLDAWVEAERNRQMK